MRPSKFSKKLLYPSLIVLATTGFTWLISHYLLEIQGEFGPEKHPLEIWSLRVHGLSAVFTTLFVGMLLEHHMLSYFKQKRRLITGLSLAVLALFLLISGYMLYYLSEDSWRIFFSISHWVLGVIGILVFALHLLVKKY